MNVELLLPKSVLVADQSTTVVLSTRRLTGPVIGLSASSTKRNNKFVLIPKLILKKRSAIIRKSKLYQTNPRSLF